MLCFQNIQSTYMLHSYMAAKMYGIIISMVVYFIR